MIRYKGVRNFHAWIDSFISLLPNVFPRAIFSVAFIHKLTRSKTLVFFPDSSNYGLVIFSNSMRS